MVKWLQFGMKKEKFLLALEVQLRDNELWSYYDSDLKEDNTITIFFNVTCISTPYAKHK